MAAVFIEAALNLIFPPLCRGCDSVLEGDNLELLCPGCCSKLQLLPDPRCRLCGAPVDSMEGSRESPLGPSSCPRCPSTAPRFESASSAVEFASPFRELVHAFKFQGSERARDFLIEWFLKGAARDFQEGDFDCVVPVPLHWWREFQREFNQAEVLGRALAQDWSVPILTKAARRARATVAQSKLPGKWRERNLAHAFLPGKQEVLGRRVLLVDDVMTSGATLSACAQALLEAGAESVRAYTLARRL